MAELEEDELGFRDDDQKNAKMEMQGIEPWTTPISYPEENR